MSSGKGMVLSIAVLTPRAVRGAVQLLVKRQSHNVPGWKYLHINAAEFLSKLLLSSVRKVHMLVQYVWKRKNMRRVDKKGRRRGRFKNQVYRAGKKIIEH